MIKLFTKFSVISAAAVFALAAPTNAQSIPDDLHKELEKKFSKRTLMASEYIKSGYKTRPLGPYIYDNYITRLGAGKLGGAAKRVRKYCEEKQKGNFVQTAQIQPNYSLSQDPITITDDGQTFSLTANDIYFLTQTLGSRKGKKGTFAENNTEGWPGAHTFFYEKLSKDEKLGIFNCQDSDGMILWSMAIIPSHRYSAEQGLSGNTLYKKDIAALPLDAETLSVYQNATTSFDGRTVQEEQDRVVEAAAVKSVTENFRLTADVGSESHCGMIIQKRSSIFEVDLNAIPARDSGKSTAWIKREDLYPEDSTEKCRID